MSIQSIRRASIYTHHLEMPFNAMLYIIKIQSMFRQRLARREAEKAKKIRLKDLAVDAAFGGRGGMRDFATREDPLALMRSTRKGKDSLIKERKKELQRALSEAQRLFEEKKRQIAVHAKALKNQQNETQPRRFSRTTSLTSNKESLPREIGDLVYEAVTPWEEVVIPVRVYRSDTCVTFQASLSTQSEIHLLRFDKASTDLEVATYYQGLVKSDEGYRLCQVSQQHLSYRPDIS